MSATLRRWLPAWQSALLWLLALITVPLLIDQWRHRDAPDQAPVQLLQDLQGRTVDLHALSAEEPVLVYFWATWCPVCRLVSPAVNDLATDHTVVSVALRSGGPEEVATYLAEHALDFRTVNDPGGHVSAPWGVRATPTLAVVHRGEIRSMTSGITTGPGMSLRLRLAEMLQK
jgi:thiol-disulfide isomerase/thioredoxin